jgi:hypothetical protein
MTQLLFEILFKTIGVAIGFLIPIVDAMMHATYLHPEEEDGAGVREAWGRKHVVDMLRSTESYLQNPARFIHRGVYFLFVFIILGLFVVTSTASPVGKGVIAGFGLHVLMIVWRHRRDSQALRDRLFWGLSKEVASEWYVGAVAMLGVVSALAVVF